MAAQLFEGTGADTFTPTATGPCGKTKAACSPTAAPSSAARTSTFETVTDNQVVTMRLGSAPEWSTASGSNDVWRAWAKTIDDEWDGSGIRLRVTPRQCRNLGVGRLRTTMGAEEKIFGMVPTRTWNSTLVAGYIGDERLFKVMKDGGEVFAYKETEGTSLVGAGQRGSVSG